MGGMNSGDSDLLQARIDQRQHDVANMQGAITITTQSLGKIKQNNSALQDRISALDSQYEQL